MADGLGVTPVAQLSMDDEVLEDPDGDLEQAVRTVVSTMAAVSSNRRAKRVVRDFLPGRAGTFRVGPYRLVVRELKGGGFTVKPWTVFSARIRG